MSKTGEKTENRLEMVFMTKDQKECVFKKFVHKIRVKTLLIIQNSLTNNQTVKQNENSNAIKNLKNCCKVLKTAWKCFS